jgi:hypothetical protein
MTPSYSGSVGAAGSAQGGVLRRRQHPRRRRVRPALAPGRAQADRHKAYEDFAAVAEDLIARDHLAAHLGIQGGSNGGLLMGNMTRCIPTCSAPPSARCRCSTCSATTSCLPARRGWANTAIPTTRRNGSSSDLLAVPQRQGRRGLPAGAVHHLDPRRPRAPRPRAQDDGAHAGAGVTTCPTTRTSRAATAARRQQAGRPHGAGSPAPRKPRRASKVYPNPIRDAASA